jgi:hypothetical protein
MSTPQPMSAQVAAVYETRPDLARLVRKRERRPPRAPTIARWTALLLLFLVTLEATCRIDDWVRFRTPLLTPISSQLDLMARDNEGVHGRPNARFQKWAMNALGMRGPEVSLAKTPGTARIVVVGASEAFGLYESPGKEFPRQLEDTLGRWLARQRCATTPARAEVLNAALPGMSLPTIEQDVRNRVRRLHADVILLYPTPVQYLEGAPPQAARPDSSGHVSALTPPRTVNSRFLDRARDQTKVLIPNVVMDWMQRREAARYARNHPPGWRFTAVPRDRLRQYDRDIRALIGTIRAIGAIPLLATHANALMGPAQPDQHLLSAWEKFYPRATGEVIVAFDSAAREVTLSAAADSGVRAVDLQSILSGGGREQALFSDFSHFTDLGSAVVAAALARALTPQVAASVSCERDAAGAGAGRELR